MELVVESEMSKDASVVIYDNGFVMVGSARSAADMQLVSMGTPIESGRMCVCGNTNISGVKVVKTIGSLNIAVLYCSDCDSLLTSRHLA